MQAITTETALTLLKRFWNIEGSARELPSYADRNFHIISKQGSFVLKIANPNWSRADLDIENAALLHLEKTCVELALPKVILTGDAQHIIPLQLGDHYLCHLRLLSYVEGEVYANLAQKPGVKQDFLQASLGSALAQLHRGLEEFTHPAMDRYVDWSISNLPDLSDEISNITPPQLQNIVAHHTDYFHQHQAQWWQTLKLSVIHNDANDFNLIVCADNANAPAKVKAIIDFGDMCRHFRVLDLAIAMTYALQHTSDDEDLLMCAMTILRAYQATSALSREELHALFHLIMARLCQSILMASKASRQSPNNDYIMISQRGVRRLICQLDAINYDYIQNQFLSVL